MDSGADDSVESCQCFAVLVEGEKVIFGDEGVDWIAAGGFYS